MKKTNLFKIMLSVFFMLFSCVSFAQTASEDAMCKKLETFYKEYYRLAMSDEPNDYTDGLIKLIKKYCTKEFAERIEYDQLNGVGLDFIMDEHVDCSYISTLSISKSDKYYKVSFDADIPDVNCKKTKKKVILAVYLKDGLVDDVDELQGWEQ